MQMHRVQGFAAGVLVAGAAWAGAQTRPSPVVAIARSDIDAVLHDSGAEVFWFLSGAGTLVTGGAVENERAFPPETEFVCLAVGPSAGGTFKGGDRRRVAPGDVVIVPAGVPHVDEIRDELTYLSIRPGLKDVLPARYVHPVLRK